MKKVEWSRAGDGRTGQDEKGQDRAVEGRISGIRRVQSRARCGREGRIRQDITGQSRAGEGTAGHGETGQDSDMARQGREGQGRQRRRGYGSRWVLVSSLNFSPFVICSPYLPYLFNFFLFTVFTSLAVVLMILYRGSG